MNPLPAPPVPDVPPPPRHPRARRHSAATMALAKQMYGDGEAWTPAQIAEYMTRRGTPVSRRTVQYWVHPRRRLAFNARRAADRRVRSGKSPHPILDRIRALRAEQVPYSAISSVMRVDGLADVSEEVVRYAFLNDREPLLDDSGEPRRGATGKVRYERTPPLRLAA